MIDLTWTPKLNPDGTIAFDQPESPIAKASTRRRKAQLVARLKSRRKYAKPVRGGTGKQARSRRRKFS